MVRDDEWPVSGQSWHNNIKEKHWSEGVSTPDGEVVEFELRNSQGEVYHRSAFKKANRLMANMNDKGKEKAVEEESGEEEDMMEEDTSEGGDDEEEDTGSSLYHLDVLF